MRQWKLAIILLVLLVIIALLLVPVPTLVVGIQNGDPVLLLPLVRDKTFTLEYTHSVLKTPVQENFVLAPDNKLLLTSTTYKSLGVGLPFSAEEGKFTNKNGLFVLEGQKRQFNTINQVFMPVAKHALLYREKSYSYSNYFTPGALVRLQVEQYTPVELMWQNLQVVRG